MKNLKNYGVQELSAKEVKNTDGGWEWSDILNGTSYYSGDNELAYFGNFVSNAVIIAGNVAQIEVEIAAVAIFS